jgi:lipoprotein-releasing system permease protein
MSFEYLIGGRYLRAKRKQSFISLITLLSAAGVAVGVMALIVVIAVMSGFEADLKDRILRGQAHIIITVQEGAFNDRARVRERVIQTEGVDTATAYIQTQVILRSDIGVAGALLRGVDPQTAGKVIQPLAGASFVPETAPEPQGVRRDVPGIIIGRELARNLGVVKGDRIHVISPRGVLAPFGHVPAAKKFIVTGYFESGMYEFDQSFAYIQLSAAQKLLRMGQAVTGIDVRVQDIYLADRVAASIERVLGPPYVAQDWMQLNRNLFGALKLEKTAMFIILTLIVMVAAFNIASSLIMLVMEKTKDIAILKAMGATRHSIRKIFVYNGLVIGCAGTVCGLGLGLVLAEFLRRYNIIDLTEDIYYSTTTLPVRLQWPEVVLILIAAVGISLMATLYPAHKASAMDPVEAIRYG